MNPPLEEAKVEKGTGTGMEAKASQGDIDAYKQVNTTDQKPLKLQLIQEMKGSESG